MLLSTALPSLPHTAEKMVSIASMAPAEKETRKMVIEIPTTVPALRPALAGSWSVEMSGSGLVGCGSVGVCNNIHVQD